MLALADRQVLRHALACPALPLYDDKMFCLAQRPCLLDADQVSWLRIDLHWIMDLQFCALLEIALELLDIDTSIPKYGRRLLRPCVKDSCRYNPSVPRDGLAVS